jgi:hypothetical protein
MLFLHAAHGVGKFACFTTPSTNTKKPPPGSTSGGWA